MSRFSLRQLLLVIVGLAIGLSIWRLPKGNWIDVPLAALSFAFVLSLCKRALATRRLLVEHPTLPREERWGGGLLIVMLLGIAGTLVVAWILRSLAAAGIVLSEPDPVFGYVDYPTLPRDLATLAMLIAISLEAWRRSPATAISPRRRMYAVVAAAAALVLIIAYWADRMLLWFLVYLAISGVEAAVPGWLPPGIDVKAAVRINRFVLGSGTGLVMVIVNLLLIAGVTKFWHEARYKWSALIFLAAGLSAQVLFAYWIAVPGLWQLSPPFQEALEVPQRAALISIALMFLLAVAAYTWRLLAKRPSADRQYDLGTTSLFFHEDWLAGMLLCLTSIAQSASTAVELASRSWLKPFEWHNLAYYLMFYPAQLIPLASAIGGFAFARAAWRGGKARDAALLPAIIPVQFGLTALSLLIVLATCAPMLAAVSFSYWFVQFGYLK